MNDTIGSQDISHPVNIARRPVNYVSTQVNGGGNGNGGNNEAFREHRKLLIYVGDMVQVIDPKSHLMGKFGLVEEICPRNPQYQVIVKIGKIRNPLKFFQLKFCTRIDSVKNNGLYKTSETNVEQILTEGNASRVSDLIDEISEEDENSGNREGMNEKHGPKL